MRVLAIALIALVLAAALPSAPRADDTASLFVNATTDDPHRAMMALGFSQGQLERQHPVTIFLNDRAVSIAAQRNAARFGAHQALLTAMMEAGATVLICPMCMKEYGVQAEDLLPGIKVGSPDVTGAALFAEGTRTLSW